MILRLSLDLPEDLSYIRTTRLLSRTLLEDIKVVKADMNNKACTMKRREMRTRPLSGIQAVELWCREAPSDTKCRYDNRQGAAEQADNFLFTAAKTNSRKNKQPQKQTIVNKNHLCRTAVHFYGIILVYTEDGLLTKDVQVDAISQHPGSS